MRLHRSNRFTTAGTGSTDVAMVPRELIDSAEIPGGGTLKLFRRGAEWAIALGGNELMNSRVFGSEEALATLALARVTGARVTGTRVKGASPRVLIGGLGMGFTLRAALAVLGPGARVCVAELMPDVVRWLRGPMRDALGGGLDDARVEIVEGDVVALIAGDAGGWDAILLDVDNGPDGLTRKGNDALYSRRGLEQARRALAPGGVLAVWSAYSDDAFRKRFAAAGFAVEEVVMRSRGGSKGARHVIWLGIRG